ncbi:retrovirus-related pol polyprotein from transposon TNT 1-94, partial [Tanacetum coccineum]
RTDTGVEGMTEGMKQNRNKSKLWKIGEIKYKHNITCWNCNQKGHFQNQCSKLVASRDKVVNMAVGDSDDALACCVENTVEDRIMDSGASFHATYCKEELERFKLCSGKVRLADGKTLDIASVGDVVLKTYFSTSWTLKVIRIGMSMLVSKGNILDVRKVDIYFCKPGGLGKQKNLSFIMSVKTRKLQRLEQVHTEGCGHIFITSIRGSSYYDIVIEDCNRSCGRAESTGIRAEASKMLWANSVSTTYLIYYIPYVLIGLRIPEEEWRGKDTSLAHLKLFGCDLFVKVKDVCGEAMKCTFIGSGSDEMRYSFQDTKSYQESQVVLVDIPENLIENDSIVAEHGLSSEITQSPGGSSDMSEGSENSGSFEDSGRSYEEYSEDGASSKEGGSKTPYIQRSTREFRAPVRYSSSANYFLLIENGEPESYS